MPKEDEHTIEFKRKQFQIWLAFSLNIHKAQGQTIKTLFDFASKSRGSGALLVKYKNLKEISKNNFHMTNSFKNLFLKNIDFSIVFDFKRLENDSGMSYTHTDTVQLFFLINNKHI